MIKQPTYRDLHYALINWRYAMFGLPLIRLTRKFMESQAELGNTNYWQPPKHYRLVYTNWDTDVRYFSFILYAPFIRLYYWYKNHRWCIEKFLIEHKILKLKEGDYYKNWYIWNKPK